MNIEQLTVQHFGAEWSKFDQGELPRIELELLFQSYFHLFPWERLTERAVGFDVGCGSGRWAFFVAPRVWHLHCIDASTRALAVAQAKLESTSNCTFHAASVYDLPLQPDSMDFGYCLGVLHHVTNPQRALRACVTRLKRGAPFLLYIYYALDNRPGWFRVLWQIADIFRRGLCRLPTFLKNMLCECIAALIYYPLARAAGICERLGMAVDTFPLGNYRNRAFYIMRNDALDRFGTPLEKRMSKPEIEVLMRNSGLTGIRFSSEPPYWCAIGYRDN